MENKVEQLKVKTRKDLRNWFLKNHDKYRSVWLIHPKGKAFPHFDVVEECLCFGWIDSTARRVDDDYTSIYIARRNPKSGWSRINKDLVKKLIADNLMQKPGLDAINLAKENGSWTKLDDVENLVVPNDLENEFKNSSEMKEKYESLSKSSKKFLLTQLVNSKRAETRIKVIKKILS